MWRPDLYDAALGAAAAPSPGEPADGIGAFAGPAFDPDDIEAHLAAWTIRRDALELRQCAARASVAGTGGLADNDGSKRGNAMNVRRSVLYLALLIASLAMPALAAAQSWPARQISAIVPLGAGSASDIIARVVMEQVGRQVGQTVVVENRPGAGGTIGANMVAKAAPDGYTVLVYGALASAHALHEKLPYDTLNDLIPVASLGQQILVIISAPAKGYKTLGDLDRRREGQARRAELFERGRRLGLAHRRRAAAHQRQLRGAAHSVQGRGRGGHRRDRRSASISACSFPRRRCRC